MLNSIYNIDTMVPAIGFVLLDLILLFWYPLNKTKVEENAAELARRRSSGRREIFVENAK